MVNFLVSTKAEAGRKLVSVNEEIDSFIINLNCLDYIPILLCLEDAINNFEINFVSSVLIEKEFSDRANLRFSINRFIAEWYEIINEAINRISDNGFCEYPKIQELPKFGFGICLQQDVEEYLMNIYKKGEIKETDFIVRKQRLFMNIIPGWMILSYNEEVHDYMEEIITNIFKLRDLFYQKGLLETMIYILPEGASIEFNDTGLRKITLPEGVTVSSVYKDQGITPRMIETFSRVFNWNSFFRSLAFESFKVVRLGKGKENIDNLKKEDEEIFNSYNSMKNYADTFCDFYEIKLKTFFDIISDIIFITYNNIHTVGMWKSNDLLNENVLKEKHDVKNVSKVIQILADPLKTKNRYDGFLIINDNVYTNFRRLFSSRIIVLEKCFGEAYNNDLKGKEFEEACRKFFNDKGFKTVPDRIEILESVIPPEISYNLWGREKKRTDVDVIACANNNVIIIECKEIKAIELKQRQINQFNKYLVEHYYKSKWIGSNINKFLSLLNNDIIHKLYIDLKKPIYLFPILVTNLLVEIDEMKRTPLITFLELYEMLILKELDLSDTEEEVGFIEIKLIDRKLNLPWIRSNYIF